MLAATHKDAIVVAAISKAQLQSLNVTSRSKQYLHVPQPWNSSSVCSVLVHKSYATTSADH